jgi:hypothetical protein
MHGRPRLVRDEEAQAKEFCLERSGLPGDRETEAVERLMPPRRGVRVGEHSWQEDLERAQEFIELRGLLDLRAVSSSC